MLRFRGRAVRGQAPKTPCCGTNQLPIGPVPGCSGDSNRSSISLWPLSQQATCFCNFLHCLHQSSSVRSGAAERQQSSLGAHLQATGELPARKPPLFLTENPPCVAMSTPEGKKKLIEVRRQLRRAKSHGWAPAARAPRCSALALRGALRAAAPARARTRLLDPRRLTRALLPRRTASTSSRIPA